MDSEFYTFTYANSQIATIRSAAPGGLTLDAPVGSVLTAENTNIVLDAVDKTGRAAAHHRQAECVQAG